MARSVPEPDSQCEVMSLMMTPVKSLLSALLSMGLVSSAVLPAASQESSAPTERRELLTRIGQSLGGAHALQVLCIGPQDQYWRNYMWNLLELEAPDAGLTRELLVDAFNSGYASQNARFGMCTGAAQQALGTIASEGKLLAEELKALEAAKKD